MYSFGIALSRIDSDLYMTVLTATAGLLGILVIHIGGSGDGLFVGNLRLAHVGLYLELTQQSVDDDLQVQLAHAGDDGLAGVGVGVGLEGRVFLGQLGQGDAHLFLTGFGLRLDGDLDNRIREFHGFENDLMFLVAEGVAGGGVLETYGSGDVAGVNLLDLLSLVGVHLQNSADSLLLALGGVIYIGT